MTESTQTLQRMSRPRLLIRAARSGLGQYSRARDLARILRGPAPVSPTAALDALMECEAEVEQRRKAADASYDIARHVEILIALMAEARLLPSPDRGSGMA